MFDAEDEKRVFSRVQTRDGRSVGKQWPTVDAGGGSAEVVRPSVAGLTSISFSVRHAKKIS